MCTCRKAGRCCICSDSLKNHKSLDDVEKYMKELQHKVRAQRRYAKLFAKALIERLGHYIFCPVCNKNHRMEELSKSCIIRIAEEYLHEKMK